MLGGARDVNGAPSSRLLVAGLRKGTRTRTTSVTFAARTMLGNLFRPWLLARLSATTVTAVVAVIAALVAIDVLRASRLGASSEGQLVVERRAELVSTLFGVGALASIVSLALAVVGADRLASSIRGAMCAYGVLEATPDGMRSLAVSAITALGCAAWLSLHRLGLALKTPKLLRLELTLALGLLPLALLDLTLALRHTLALDFRVVASCCSSGLEDVRAAVEVESGGPRTLATALFFGAGLMSIALFVVAWRRPTALAATATAVLGLGTAALALPAITWWVAPHVYESPAHLCPFCLLHADAGFIGYPLGALVFLAAARGAGLGAFALLSRRSAEHAALAPEAARLARSGALAWAALLTLCALPWAQFAWRTGGASLFGG